MPLYYCLAKGAHGLQPSGARIWAHEVALCFEPVDRPVCFSEDIGHGGVGGCFTAQEALQSQWTQHFVIAQGEWLLPFIRQMAEGSVVDREQVLPLYRSQHGGEPLSFAAKDS